MFPNDGLLIFPHLDTLFPFARQYLRGSVGVLFTNKSRDYVESWFKTHAETDFARSGNEATEKVSLEAGTSNARLRPHRQSRNKETYRVTYTQILRGRVGRQIKETKKETQGDIDW